MDRRSVCLEALASGVAFGQETAAVGWDPRQVGYPLYSWQELAGAFLGSLLLAAYLYVCWRLLSWLVRRYQERTGWVSIRYWLPSAMWIAAAALVSIASLGSESLLGVTLGVVLLLTGPVFVLVLGVLSYVGLGGWFAAMTASVLFWCGWYFLVRIVEWRLDETAPDALHIT